ncbi:hypothetical protein DFH09DRAFT_1470167 [Mycena vulgaris]|nr:hypothetical protein DFH09DRAFT_1470167 [Mycena vulgaris]
MHLGPVATLLAFLVVSCVITPCHAERLYQWSFKGASISDTLPSCHEFDISVSPVNPANNTHGTPPFYMLSFEVGGTPIRTLLGTAEDNLKWVVNHAVGSKLLLEVVDSLGSSGGVPANLLTVTKGLDTQCLPPVPSPPLAAFTVTANVTDKLNTCQPWGLRIKGGSPPYNVTFAALNSPIITNVTTLEADDAYTYINRADPGTQLIAGVSDSTGRWASGTPIVKTVGSTDTTCGTLNSGSGNSAQLEQAQQQEAALALAASKAKKKTGVIAGVVVTLLVLLLGGAAVFLYMRRRKTQQKVHEITPRQFEAGDAPQTFEPNGGQILSINAFISPGSPTQPRSTQDSSLRSTAGASPARPKSVASSGMSVRNPDRPAAFTSFPTASVRRSAKEIEAGLPTGNSLHSDYSGDGGSDVSSQPLVSRARSAMPSSGPSGARYPARSASVGAPSAEIIFQHEDAGVVRELPPPYADRGREP